MDVRQVKRLQDNTGSILWPIAKKADLGERLVSLCKQTKFDPARLQAEFKAEFKETYCFYSPKLDQNVFLLGLGEQTGHAEVLQAFRFFTYQMRKRLGQSLGVVTGDLPALPMRELVTSIVLGIKQGAYQIPNHKSENQPAAHPLAQEDAVLQLIGKQANLSDFAKRALLLSETQAAMMHLVNAPANYKTPKQIADAVLLSARKYGYQAEAIIGREAIEKAGLHALNAVNLGSPGDPVFLILSYTPQGTDLEKTPHLGLVGKGVTFDTGGISLKDPGAMYNMKSDMGGAAAVIGAVEAAARMALPIRVSATIPLTENMVDGHAIRPSDIIGSYSGRSIEIIDTDAEGRLILADGVSYMVRNLKPDVLIDLATLTGSIIRSLGYHAAGLFTSNDRLAQQLYDIGQASGERLWRMPLWSVYQDEIQSDIADVRNLGSKPMAGATAAAKFIEVFTDKHPRWAHLDIAGTAFGNIEYSTTQKAATGFGIRLLVQFMESLQNKGLAPLDN